MRYPLGDWLHNKISSRQEYKEKMAIYRDKQSQYVAKRLFEIYGFEIAQKYKPNYVQDFIPCMGNVIYIAKSLENAKNKSLHTIFEKQGRTNIQFYPTSFHFKEAAIKVEKHFKQLIIARRDLNMSPGKLAAQVSHASSAFLIEMIRDSWPGKAQGFYQVNYRLDEDIYDNWINDGVTKVVIEESQKKPLKRLRNQA